LDFSPVAFEISTSHGREKYVGAIGNKSRIPGEAVAVACITEPIHGFVVFL